MIWFSLLLVIFWKPIYWLTRYIYLNFYKKETASASNYLKSINSWFIVLWGLVFPGDHK